MATACVVMLGLHHRGVLAMKEAVCCLFMSSMRGSFMKQSANEDYLVQRCDCM